MIIKEKIQGNIIVITENEGMDSWVTTFRTLKDELVAVIRYSGMSQEEAHQEAKSDFEMERR